MNRHTHRDWQEVTVDLGFDPENEPPDMDEPACEHCGRTLVCQPRAKVCEFCVASGVGPRDTYTPPMMMAVAA